MSKEIFMTKTIQSCSRAALCATHKKLTIKKPETEDNMRLLLLICDSLNELYEKLSRLNYVMERRIIERNLYHKGKGEKK